MMKLLLVCTALLYSPSPDGGMADAFQFPKSCQPQSYTRIGHHSSQKTLLHFNTEQEDSLSKTDDNENISNTSDNTSTNTTTQHQQFQPTPPPRPPPNYNLKNTNNINSSNNNVKTLQNRNAILQHALKTKTQDLSGVQTKLTLLEEVVTKMKYSNRSLIDQLKKASEEMESTKALLANEQARVQELEESTMDVEGLELTIEELQDQTDRDATLILSIQTQIQGEKKKRMNLAEKYHDSTVRLEEAGNRMKNFHEELERKDWKMEELEKMLVEKDLELETLLTIIDEEEEKKKGKNNEDSVDIKKEAEIKKLEAKCQTLTNDLKSLQSQYSKSKDQVQEVSDQYKKRRNELEEALKNERQKSTSYKADIDNIYEQGKIIETQLNEKAEELASLQKLYDEQIGSQGKLGDDYEKQRKEQEEKLEQAMEIAEASVKQAEEREKQLIEKISALNNQIQSLEAKCTRYETEEANKKEVMRKERTDFQSERQMERINWEQKLQSLKHDYENQIYDMEKKIESLNSTLNTEESQEENSGTIDESSGTGDIDEVPAKRQRLYAAWQRVKSPRSWFQRAKKDEEEVIDEEDNSDSQIPTNSGNSIESKMKDDLAIMWDE